jgi:hypothetical protein
MLYTGITVHLERDIFMWALGGANVYVDSDIFHKTLYNDIFFHGRLYTSLYQWPTLAKIIL